MPGFGSQRSGAPFQEPRSGEDIWGPSDPSGSSSGSSSGLGQGGAGRIVLMGFTFLFLVVVGAVIGANLIPWTDMEEQVIEPIEATPARWSPGSGPLVEGIEIPGERPARLRWSLDGRQLGWSSVDSDRGRRVATVIEVGSEFSEPVEADPQPDWLTAPRPSGDWTVSIEHGLVVVRGPTRPEGEVVDLGQMQLHSVSSPALYERGDRLWLAVVGLRGTTAEVPTLHVIELTRLVARR
ncbi:MAG: hypothetical protein EA397_13375 [Deltaproteobacteria bacterium]|nr:MAG: hypothetical protein EA397_13375 [Deltaproteobacteria bacterium]